MSEIVVLRTRSITYEQAGSVLAEMPEVEVRTLRGAIGSEELLLAFSFSAEKVRRVLSALKDFLTPKGSITIETETIGKDGRKTRKKLEVKEQDLAGPIDILELWKRLE